MNFFKGLLYVPPAPPPPPAWAIIVDFGGIGGRFGDGATTRLRGGEVQGNSSNEVLNTARKSDVRKKGSKERSRANLIHLNISLWRTLGTTKAKSAGARAAKGGKLVSFFFPRRRASWRNVGLPAWPPSWLESAFVGDSGHLLEATIAPL